MALVFHRIQTKGIAELSYLLVDDCDGVATVIDPTPDVEKYVTNCAREENILDTGRVTLPDLLHMPRGVFVPAFALIMIVALHAMEHFTPR